MKCVSVAPASTVMRGSVAMLGTVWKSRILIRNAGEKSAVFRTWTWHQVGHKSRDANGDAIKLPDGYDTWDAAWRRGGTVL